MTIEQHEPGWTGALVGMGFSFEDVERVRRAGMHNLLDALDYLQMHKTTTSSDDTDFSFQQSSRLSQPPAPTFNAAPRTTLSKARDSLDRIDVSRLPHELPPGDNVDNNLNKKRNVSSDSPNPTQPNSLPTVVEQPKDAFKISSDDELKRAIELSRKEQQDREMRQALLISKQDGTSAGVLENDPEILRAIEESLKDTPRNVGDRAVSWQSHGYNNVDRAIRKNLNEPVGLRNIGNTCYLNSLLQVYFHLPDFRRAILSFRAPKDLDSGPSSTDQVQHSIQSAPTANSPNDLVDRKSESTSDCIIVPLSDTKQETVTTDTQMKENAVVDSTTPATSSAPVTEIGGQSNMGPPPAPGETSGSDKSDNRDELRGESEEMSKRHAVEFVVELQRLFASMALGNQACVDPTSIAHAMRDGDGNPIKIGDQQDASEFNHLFLDIVEKGLRYESETEIKNSSEDLTKDSCNAAASPVGRGAGTADIRTNCDCMVVTDESGNESSSRAGGKIVNENVVKELFTVKFRQEVQRCDADGTPKDTEGESTSTMVTDGETNCIIVDATTRKERDLYNGLEDYAITRIEYNVATGTGDGQAGNSETDSVSGKDATTAAVEAIKDDERVASAPLQGLSKAVDTTHGLEQSGSGDAMQDVEVQTASQSSNWALKSVWLTKLPPVLVIYLQRVRYIREKSIAEKVHDKYEFAPEIALDRYLEKNREASGRARERVSRIRKERRRLTTLVRKYRSFPTNAESSSDMDVLMGPVVDKDMDMGMGDGELFSAGGRIRKRLLEALNPCSELFSVEGLSKERVDSAIGTIELVLENDRKQCERYERQLASLDTEGEVYRGMDREKYRLHAVLVHDGAPSGGHYWTFIRNWEAKDGEEMTWMKFSDSSVRRVSEKDMLVWSVGGHGRASAYCLIYTSASAGVKMDERGGAVRVTMAEECRRLLPVSRMEEVERSNADHVKVATAVTTVTVADDDNIDNNHTSDGYGGMELNQGW